MTLSSGAHVKIGTVEFKLEESQQNHYVHAFQRVSDPSTALQGQDDKRQLSGRLLWTFEDWSGGEGNRIYYPDEPNKFWFAQSANPRVRGQITGRPKRTKTAITVSSGSVIPFFVLGGGELSLWMGRNSGTNQYQWAQRGTGNWSGPVTDTATTNYFNALYSVCGDLSYQYWSSYNSVAAVDMVVGRRTSSSISTIYTFAGSRPYLGMGLMGEFFYGWDGNVLYKHTPSAMATRTAVSPTVPSGISPYNPREGGLTVCDNEVVVWTAKSAQSQIFSYHEERGFSELWKVPNGLEIQGGAYVNGVLYMTAQDQDTTNPQSHLYGINMNTREAFYVASTPPGANTTSWQQIIGCEKNSLLIIDFDGGFGYNYIYDTEIGALTPFDYHYVTSNPDTTDTLTNTGSSGRYVADCAWFASKRFTVIMGGSAAAEFHVAEYESDEPEDVVVNTATGDYSTRVVMPYHDMGYPHDGKNLVGFHISYQVDDTTTTSGLKVGQEIAVAYKLDGDPSPTTIATITSSTTPSSGIKGRHFISALTAGTKKGFFQIAPEFTLYTKNDTSTGAKCPVVKAFTVEAEPNGYLESWDLIVRVKDELPGERPSNRALKAEDIRDYIEDLAQARDPVTFLDGARYRKRGQYTTHTVMVDGPVDVIERNAEGYMAIRLKAVVI